MGMIEVREQRGLAIAALSRLTHKGAIWLVPSQSGRCKCYTVSPDAAEPFCNCPDFEERQEPCKHVFAARFVMRRENADGSVSHGQAVLMTEITETPPRPSPRPTYRQDWPNYNLAQTREKHEFQELLFDLCQNHLPAVKRGRGRPTLLPADIVFACVSKVYETISARRFISDLSDAHEKGYVTHLPSHNSIQKYLESEELTPILHELIRISARPLAAVEADFAIDSTGFTCRSYTRYYDMKYRGKHEHNWVKLHAMAGVKSNVITAVVIKGRDAADAPQLPELLELNARHFSAQEVSADKVYGSVSNLEAIERVGARAFIYHKSNHTERRGGIWARSVHFFKYHKDEFKAHYHKRSNIETSFSMVKRRFGGWVRSRTERSQVNEVLCKVLCHNICVMIHSIYELGIAPEFFPKEPPAAE
jgi:transposase